MCQYFSLSLSLSHIFSADICSLSEEEKSALAALRTGSYLMCVSSPFLVHTHVPVCGRKCVCTASVMCVSALFHPNIHPDTTYITDRVHALKTKHLLLCQQSWGCSP